MKHRSESSAPGRALRRLGLLSLLAACTCSCSLLFVTPPKPGGGRKCTSSRLAPVLDSIFAGAQVVRTGLAVGASDEVYERDDVPLSRGADIGIGIGLTALFTGSAAYGFSNTARCERRQGGYEREEQEEDEHEPDLQGDFGSTEERKPPETSGPVRKRTVTGRGVHEVPR